MTADPAGTIKVLSIDGGGIRGIIPSIILAALAEQIGADLHTVFDLISGTSTGGIIALGIGTACNAGRPYAPAELLNLYVENGPAIFHKGLVPVLQELNGPKYSPDALETCLQRFFGATKFSSALTPLLISSYDLQSQLPFFFKSHKIARDPNYDWNVTDIARSTSAAPTYFPPYHLARGNDDYALVDGGVCVNNPAMAAYADARRLYPAATRILVVAVGTGNVQDHITYEQSKGWGLLGWARQIVPVLMDSVSESVDFELECIRDCDYFRLQPEDLTPASGAMDDVTPENLTALQDVAHNYVTKNATQLNKIADLLKPLRASTLSGIGN
jgi:patatin-like phospholipase/acyl hydrolase